MILDLLIRVMRHLFLATFLLFSLVDSDSLSLPPFHSSSITLSTGGEVSFSFSFSLSLSLSSFFFLSPSFSSFSPPLLWRKMSEKRNPFCFYSSIFLGIDVAKIEALEVLSAG